MDLIFQNVTAITMQKNCPVISSANIGVKDGRIAFIDSQATPSPAEGHSSFPNTRIIDGTSKILIPGLYNCHAHIPTSLLRGFANDLVLEEWLFNHIFPAEQKIKDIPNAVYTGAMLSIAEMIASGTIAFSDMYFHLPEIAKAVEESGVKANLSNAVLSFDSNNYNFHDQSECKETLYILEHYHHAPHGRIIAEASIHCAYTSHPSAWQQVAEFAKEHQLHMHVHLSETITEHNNSLNQFDLTPAQAFAQYGVFDVPTVAAHACWVSEDDIEILAQHDVTVAHNPVSNLKLASGVAPIVAMLEKNINITLGTDGMASNNTHDLFEEIKLASILQKCANEDPTVLPALQVLEMATVNGAKAQGRQGGIIMEGYDADLVLLDFNNPRQTPCYNPLVNLAYSTTGRDVVMTLCQGRVLYENGEYKTIDIEKIQHEVNGIAKMLF